MITAKRLLLPTVLLLVAACGKETADSAPDGREAALGARIPASQVPLYGNLKDYELVPSSPGTRSAEEAVTLGSLLEADGVRTVRFEGVEFTQTPFRQNREEILAGYGGLPEPDPETATVVRKFFVETVQEGVPHRYVVTMVTEADYFRRNPGFDYLDMPGYTGAVLLSLPDGTVFRAETYRNGLLRKAVLLRKDEIPSDGSGKLHYVKLYGTATRSGDDGPVLQSAVCLAEKSDENDRGAGFLAHPQYRVSITTNLPDYAETKGNGTYSSGSWATLGCQPRFAPLSLEFGRWTGAFLGERRPYFPWKVTRDIVATAYFLDEGPCLDLDRGVVNPLRQMAVAATASGSYVNGTYKALRGYDEEGNPRYHWGIDLAAKEGTPVYSMYAGRIVRIESDHPDAYEEGSFGNVIVTENDVRGYDGKVYLQYAHLRHGTPVAVNPRTGKPFEKGDEVFAGDLIGYTGKTGNAFSDTDVPNKHLDLMAAFGVDPASGRIRSGTLTDPAPLLNGTVDPDNLQKRQGKIDRIRCD